MTVIEVTAEDIRIGRRGKANRCPVRRALRRAGIPAVAVFDDWYDLADGSMRRLTVYARLWVQRFDAGDPVTPFTFQVSP